MLVLFIYWLYKKRGFHYELGQEKKKDLVCLKIKLQHQSRAYFAKLNSKHIVS